jgi:integrase
VAWATLPPDRHASWGSRLTDVRGFARHVASIDPETDVPRIGILPPLKRAKPYVYSDAEIDALLKAALALPPATGLRRWTYHYLFGLIVVTGMRLSEAIGLERADVDLEPCRQSPSDAHPQIRLGRKVSDEFTVPLCRSCELHRHVDEEAC